MNTKINFQSLNLVVKFIFVGCFVALVQMILLYVFHGLIGLPSLTASTIAFIFSIFTNFLLQKFWTFQDFSIDRTPQQLSIFLLNSFFNLLINFFLIYVFIEKMIINAYIAQAITLILIAIFNFFIYKKIIFKFNHE